jgi:hypothetical protein
MLMVLNNDNITIKRTKKKKKGLYLSMEERSNCTIKNQDGLLVIENHASKTHQLIFLLIMTIQEIIFRKKTLKLLVKTKETKAKAVAQSLLVL